jgi:hypothetical protein
MSRKALIIAGSAAAVLAVALVALFASGGPPTELDSPAPPPAPHNDAQSGAGPTAAPGAPSEHQGDNPHALAQGGQHGASPDQAGGEASLTQVDIPWSSVTTTELEHFVQTSEWPQVGARVISKSCDTDPCIMGFEFDPTAEDFEAWKAEMGRQGWEAADDDSQLSVAEQTNGDKQQAWFYWVPDQMDTEQAQAFHAQTRAKLMATGGPDIGE